MTIHTPKPVNTRHRLYIGLALLSFVAATLSLGALRTSECDVSKYIVEHNSPSYVDSSIGLGFHYPASFTVATSTNQEGPKTVRVVSSTTSDRREPRLYIEHSSITPSHVGWFSDYAFKDVPYSTVADEWKYEVLSQSMLDRGGMRLLRQEYNAFPRVTNRSHSMDTFDTTNEYAEYQFVRYVIWGVAHIVTLKGPTRFDDYGVTSVRCQRIAALTLIDGIANTVWLADIRY